MWQSYLNTPPLEYVAPIAAWICTDEASYISQLYQRAGAPRGWRASFCVVVLCGGACHLPGQPFPGCPLDFGGAGLAGAQEFDSAGEVMHRVAPRSGSAKRTPQVPDVLAEEQHTYRFCFLFFECIEG